MALAAFLLVFAGSAAWAQVSAFASQMDGFTKSLVAQLSAKTAKGSAIAIADFDNVDAAIGDPNLGYAVSEIVTQDFQRSGNFVVLERKQLQQILKTMELQLSGLYDSDKAVAIGKLINAQYLMVGSITKTAGFY
jgi:curli biogenesis system outer membrane secretion channel CsgG